MIGGASASFAHIDPGCSRCWIQRICCGQAEHLLQFRGVRQMEEKTEIQKTEQLPAEKPAETPKKKKLSKKRSRSIVAAALILVPLGSCVYGTLTYKPSLNGAAASMGEYLFHRILLGQCSRGRPGKVSRTGDHRSGKGLRRESATASRPATSS